jgi:hypothetical protein
MSPSNNQNPEEQERVFPKVDLALITKSILLPFFQIRTRILEKGKFFKIGDMEFYVATTEPHEYGKITSQTIIRCNL